MRPGLKTWMGMALVAPGIFVATVGWSASFGDEPSRLSRFFRFGGGGSTSNPAPSNPTPSPNATPAVPPIAPEPLAANSGGLGESNFNPSGPVTPGPRLVPQPRVTRAATESDPIVTRISLARSNEGHQFGMFLQVYADGTVIDSDGVHHVSEADLKPLADALAASELYRLRGHCGSPATDFVEQVQVIVYERSLGRLRANAFSYSGNPQGCDHTVRHLHAALDTLQTKISRPSQPTGPVTGGVTPVQAAPVPPAGNGPTIPLTPIN